MKVLVTGAGGFVGRALVPYLSELGFEVVAATRLGISPGEVAVADIGPVTNWTVALAGCQAVVHAAARVDRMEESAMEGLEKARRVNTAGSLELARQAATAGVRRFIFISSVKVNGESGFFNANSPCQPVDAYGISKHEAEVGLAEIATQTGMQLIVLRLPIVYGPGVGSNFLRLMRLVERGLPLPFAAVDNRRSLVYLGNLIDAIGACLRTPIVGNYSWYVSDNEVISVPELICALSSAMGVKNYLLPLPPFVLHLIAVALGKAADSRRLLGSLVVDSASLREELGWRAPYSMAQGLRATVVWYREQRAE